MDKHEEYHERKLQELYECHKNKNRFSCVGCNSFFSCKLRYDYVASVYNSMSKGNTGGFEF